MKLNTKRMILSAAGLMLSASNTLAAATNTSSTDIVGNLGFFSTVAGTIMMYAKYVAFFIAIISLLALWVSGMLGKLHHKIGATIDAHEGLKKWLDRRRSCDRCFYNPLQLDNSNYQRVCT